MMCLRLRRGKVCFREIGRKGASAASFYEDSYGIGGIEECIRYEREVRGTRAGQGKEMNTGMLEALSTAGVITTMRFSNWE